MGGAPTNRGSFNPRSKILCHNCGLPGHIKNECKKPKIISFGCGKEGHIKPECPNKPAVSGFNKGGGRPGGAGGFIAGGGSNRKNNNGKRGRSFGKQNCTSLEEVNNSDMAVLGMLSILTHHGKVLFDTGAMNSFISSNFVDKYGLRCEPL